MLSTKLLITHIFILIFSTFIGIYYSKVNLSYLLSYWSYQDNKKVSVYNVNQLAEYNGLKNEKIYTALLGIVYDVTASHMHYGKGAAYHYFAGKDGSKAFVTGNFEDNSDEKDDVLQLSCSDLLALLHWRKTFNTKYKDKGVLSGRFYDERGHKTQYSKDLSIRLKECKAEKSETEKQDTRFPPCNIEWSKEKGSRVWCTNSSGGIKREWVGVPRQLYIPDKNTKRCACVNLDKDEPSALLKEYNNCSPISTSCIIDE